MDCLYIRRICNCVCCLQLEISVICSINPDNAQMPIMDICMRMMYNMHMLYDGRGAQIPEEYIKRSQRRAQLSTPERQNAVSAANTSHENKPRTQSQAPTAHTHSDNTPGRSKLPVTRTEPQRTQSQTPPAQPRTERLRARQSSSQAAPLETRREMRAAPQLPEPAQRTHKAQPTDSAGQMRSHQARTTAVPAHSPKSPERKPAPRTATPQKEQRTQAAKAQQLARSRSPRREMSRENASKQRPLAQTRNAPAKPRTNAPPADIERRRDMLLRKRLRLMHETNSALRCLCVMVIALVTLLMPTACAPDDTPIKPQSTQKVVLPASMATPTPEPAVQPTQASEPLPEPTPVKVTISAAGDCTLGYDPRMGYNNSLPNELERQDGDYGYFLRGVLPVFSSDDLTVVNLECALTKSDDNVEGKTFCFKGDPLYRNILLEGSVEVVSLGNNHSRDYRSEGFNDTIESLRLGSIGFAYNGISCIRQVNGVQVGFLSYKNNTPELSTLKSDIESLREKGCGVVICSFHWGDEYRNVANSSQTKLGRAAVDYGADLVLGHHPHVIGSIELYKGKYICYSLGNFCFGGNRNPDDKDTFIFRQTFEIGDDGAAVDAGIEIVPCRISSTTKRNDYQPTIYGEEDARRVLKRLNEYSAPLKYGAQLSESVLKWDWQLEGQ